MTIFKIKDKLPPLNKYVLGYLGNVHNLGDVDDPINLKWNVVKRVGGMSIKDREKLDDGDKRKITFCSADEWGNNLVNYRWDSVGGNNYFGQEVTHWCFLPNISKHINKYKFIGTNEDLVNHGFEVSEHPTYVEYLNNFKSKCEFYTSERFDVGEQEIEIFKQFVKDNGLPETTRFAFKKVSDRITLYVDNDNCLKWATLSSRSIYNFLYDDIKFIQDLIDDNLLLEVE